MRSSLEVVEALDVGSLSLDEAARALGVSTDEVSRQLEMMRYARTFARRERRAMNVRLARTTFGVLAVVALSSTVWFVRAANAAGTCAQTLPAPLVTFCADQPALASEVNGDIQGVLNFLTNKTGPLSTSAITTSAVTVSGNVTAASGNINGQLVVGSSNSQAIDMFGNSYGMGLQTWTTYFRTGGGFSWFLNGTHVGGNRNDPGAGGTTLMSLDGNGLTLTAINGRRPAYTATNRCNTGTCTASCGAGVVKMAFGFHGFDGTGNDSGDWLCGSGMQWLGHCIGSNTCTVTTGCGSSSLLLECW